jgi:hypothetical protein
MGSGVAKLAATWFFALFFELPHGSLKLHIPGCF